MNLIVFSIFTYPHYLAFTTVQGKNIYCITFVSKKIHLSNKARTNMVQSCDANLSISNASDFKSKRFQYITAEKINNGLHCVK